MQKRYLRFGLIGVFNTLFNLVLFNFFIFGLNLSVSNANVFSLLISIAISFFLNTKFVFTATSVRRLHLTFASFLAITLFTQLVIQQLVVIAFTESITLPGRVAFDVLHHLPLLGHLSQRFYLVNVAKCLAVAVSLVANFLAYDRFVFPKNEEPPLG